MWNAPVSFFLSCSPVQNTCTPSNCTRTAMRTVWQCISGLCSILIVERGGRSKTYFSQLPVLLIARRKQINVYRVQNFIASTTAVSRFVAFMICRGLMLSRTPMKCFFFAAWLIIFVTFKIAFGSTVLFSYRVAVRSVATGTCSRLTALWRCINFRIIIILKSLDLRHVNDDSNTN